MGFTGVYNFSSGVTIHIIHIYIYTLDWLLRSLQKVPKNVLPNGGFSWWWLPWYKVKHRIKQIQVAPTVVAKSKNKTWAGTRWFNSWPFYPLLGGHLTFEGVTFSPSQKGHQQNCQGRDIVKKVKYPRSPLITLKIFNKKKNEFWLIFSECTKRDFLLKRWSSWMDWRGDVIWGRVLLTILGTETKIVTFAYICTQLLLMDNILHSLRGVKVH